MVKDVSEKAKPCPMCGSKRIYIPEIKYDLLYSINIRCADCGLTGYKNFSKDAKDTIQKTIEYWNTRHDYKED